MDHIDLMDGKITKKELLKGVGGGGVSHFPGYQSVKKLCKS